MAALTPDELRRRPGADAEPNAGTYVHEATNGDAERPVRHLVIFPRLSRSRALRPFAQPRDVGHPTGHIG
jgi:hypothetical protein